MEFVWTLRSMYGHTKERALDQVAALLSSKELEFDDGESAWGMRLLG